MGPMSDEKSQGGGPAATAGSPVSVVVLAAGASRRMGPENKLLSKIGGPPLVRLAVQAAVDSAANEVIVVTGHEAETIRAALTGLEVRFVHNPDYDNGLSTSLGAGIEAVGADHSAAVVVLADMPRVTTGIIDALIESFHAEGGTAICRPVSGGKPGNPVLWPRAFFPEINKIQGDTGARALLKIYSDKVLGVDVGGDGIFIDIDTPEDLNSV